MNLSALSLRHAALTAVGALLCAGSALAASPQERVSAERAACESGRSGQDRATCLREVGAAQQERQRNNLNNVQGDAQLRANAAARCDRLPPDRREGCMALRGSNVQTQGSVQGGGVLRQTTIREVGEPRPVAAPQPGYGAQTMPAPGAAQPMPAPQPGYGAQPMPAPGAVQPMPAPGMTPPPPPPARPMPAPGMNQPMPAPGMNAPMPAPGMNAPMPQGSTGTTYGSGTGLR